MRNVIPQNSTEWNSPLLYFFQEKDGATEKVRMLKMRQEPCLDIIFLATKWNLYFIKKSVSTRHERYGISIKMVLPFINGNSRGCQGTVILLLKPHSFDGIGNFKILDLPYETKLIW
jgi:hypothetical protein